MSLTNETFEFLADLEKNNTKAWFEDNRDRYEQHWKSAGLAFIDQFAALVAKQDPALKAEVRLNGSLRRINRDVRFSKDKSPYNARLHMIFWSGSHPTRSPGLHIVLQPGGVGFGAGHFAIDPKALAAYRARILDDKDAETLQSAIASAKAVNCSLGPPDLARIPKGFDANHPRAELLRYKAFVARTYDKPVSAKVLGPDKADAWMQKTTAALMPLIRWLS
ncbi:MAG: TIGR02453 family protein [Boseongicola sp.]|nr:MAG: TIGR02453 family protein [Boseongicola sp.]